MTAIICLDISCDIFPLQDSFFLAVKRGCHLLNDPAHTSEVACSVIPR